MLLLYDLCLGAASIEQSRHVAEVHWKDVTHLAN